MRDWKIGARITLGFVTVIALSIVLGVFACCRVLTIERKATEVAKGNVPSVIALGHIQSEIYRVFELLLQHAASSDQQEVDTLEAQVRSIRDTNAKAYRTYEALPSTPEGVAIYEKVTADRTEFWSIVEEVSSGSRPGTDAGNAQAAKIVETRLRPVLRRYVEDLQAILDLDNKGTQEGLAEVVRSGSSANWGILIGLILCIAISAPITFLILRSISVPLAQAAAALEQVAKGDLTVTVDVRSKDEFGQMGMTLNNALKKLRCTLNEVSASAARTSSSSHELAAAAKEIAAGAQQQAASLEETSASLEEITAAVRQSADNACQVSQLAIGSRESAEKGQEVVSGSIAAMAEIDAASAKISDISSTIHEIAFQTNLLAVNAAIEAARAGEDGRGFAVVAMEVRSLAQRSAEAAKEIKGLIQDSLEKVKKGSELVNSSGSTLQGIVGLVKRVTDIVGEIASAAAEQSLGVEQVNSAITQMDRVTQSNSARTEELSSTAQSLAGQAAELMQLVATFTLGTERAPHGNRGPEPVHEANRDSVHGSHRVPSMTSVVSRDSPSPDTNGRKPSEPVFAVAAPRGADDANFEEF